jgi:hypothetical protein
MELSGAALWLTQRGWTFCPARAHPFWIKRGVCSLHDLEKVGKRGEEKEPNVINIVIFLAYNEVMQ